MTALRFWWRQPQIAGLIKLYRAMSAREQTLIRTTVVVCVLALALWLLALPAWERIQKLHVLQLQAQKEVSHLSAHLKALRDSRLYDPNQAVRDELARIKAQQALLDERINALTKALVSPAQMTSLLKDMLAQNKNLKTRSLQTLPPQRVDLGDGFDDVQLFRHSLQLTMEASYPALVDYLRRLDEVPWLLGWESLEFNISRYPRGDVVLKVSTLSRRQEVLGGD